MILYRKITIDTRTDSTKIYSESEPRRSIDTTFPLGGAPLQFHPKRFAELRVAFVLNLLDLGDEELPGALGVREVQGGLARTDQDTVVLDTW